MIRTVTIRNNTNQEKIWLKTFAANEQYTIPNDNSLVAKYATLDVLLTAIANGEASIGNGTNYFTTVNDQLNWLKQVEPDPRDLDSRILVRTVAAKAGWTYQLNSPEFETSKLGSLLHDDVNGNALNQCTLKFYDTNNVELTTQQDCDTSCVKTVLDFEPPFDYEIVGGTIKPLAQITTDVRCWVTAVPDIAAPTGSKVMVQDVNLKFVTPENGIVADGKVSKYLAYSNTYHSNKLRVTLKHPAGEKHKVAIWFYIFAA